jgi:hypothetical protein
MTEGVDEDWQRLVDALGTLGAVTTTERGLAVDLGHRTVELVMTPDDWDDMPVVHGGYPVEETLEQVRSQPGDVRFLVYDGQYALEPCVTPFLPPDPEALRLEDLARQYPNGIPGAGWFAYAPDGSKDFYRDALPDGTPRRFARREFRRRVAWGVVLGAIVAVAVVVALLMLD